MYRILVCALLLLSAPLALNQQPQQPGQGRPPYTTPPTFPENQQHQPPLAMPPDQVPAASSDIQDQLQRSLIKDPDFKDAQVQTRVDDHAITLKGTVQDEVQHQKVLQLAQTLAGKRKIVENLVVKQKS